MHQTGFSADPVTLEADTDLTDDDTEDLEVGLGRDPVFIADLICRPTLRPDLLEKRCQVSDRKQRVAFGEELTWVSEQVAAGHVRYAYTETTQDISRKVRSHRAERVFLEHPANDFQFPLCLLVGLVDRPSATLGAGQISPVYTIDVRIFRAQVVPQRVFRVDALSIVERFWGMRRVKLVVGIRRDNRSRLVDGTVAVARRGRGDHLGGRVELNFTHGGLVEDDTGRARRT